LQKVFNDNWTNYNKTSLLASATSTDFGELKNREEVRDFIEQHGKV
jgi:hypothetical protein